MVRTTAVVTALLLAVSVPATAQVPIGLIDMDRIFEEESRFARAQGEIDDMVAQFEREREEWEKDLRDLSERIQQVRESRRDSEIEMYTRRMAEKSQEYQRFMEETFGPEGIIEKNSNEIMEPLYEKLESACEKVGEAQGIPLIVDQDNLGVWYAADTLDVTTAVLDELKRIW